MDLDFETLSLLKKDFGLTENHLMIMKFLFAQREGVSAEDIWSDTRVPKGRVYEFLSDLIDLGFLRVEYSRPKKYFLKKPSDGLRDALKLKEYAFLDLGKKTVRVASKLDRLWSGEPEGPVMKFFSARDEDYSSTLIDMFLNASRVMSTTSPASFMSKDGLKLSISTLMNRLNEPGFSLKLIFADELVEEFFFSKGGAAELKVLRDLLKYDNVVMRVLPFAELTAYRGFLTDKSVMINFQSVTKDDRKSVYIESVDLSDTLTTVFDDNLKRARPVDEKYLKDLESKMEDYKYFKGQT